MYNFHSELTSQVDASMYSPDVIPPPEVVPDVASQLKDSSVESGDVVFDFNRLDLDTYALPGGKLKLSTAFGIEEDVLYILAEQALQTHYKANDIQLGDWKYITSTQYKRIVIKYRVDLED